VIHELSELGGIHIVLHEGETNWEEQMKQRICHSSWEIYLSATDNRALIDEVFLFYDEDEYLVFTLSGNTGIVESALEDYLRKHYEPLLSCHEHIQSCLANLPAIDEVSAPSLTGEEAEAPDDPLAFLPKSIKDTGIKVSSQKLDELLNLVSELVITTATLDAQTSAFHDTRLKNAIENLEKLTKKFRSNALDLRLIPVGNLLRKFNRQVRDLSASLNKRVNLILEGQETEIDKTILKSIESPLLHIIRNSIDHGIESPAERKQKGKSAEGRLKIAAFYSGANVVIQVHDDGRGINMERIRESAIEKGYITEDQQVTEQELLNLIMEPGFTTSRKVSMVSGRGVGMDVVKKELNAIGGSIEIETEKDLGTSITMKLPTTLSIIDSLLLEVDQSRILIPLLEVEYCYRESRSNIYGKNSSYLPYKDNMVPFISLRRKFKFSDLDAPEEMVIIISKYDKKYALIVDDIIGEQQAVIKPLGELFINQPYYSGGSIMADGKLALVLDTNYLFNQSILN
jgi:two-component system chemotaxis sensor kinase CheA